MSAPPADARARPLRDLRISVTDRCNLRCGYCMPREVFGPDHAFLPHAEILTYEELRRLVGLFTALGAEKVRVTGGEPLLRRDLPDLIAMLGTVDGVRDLALTTNGTALTRLAGPLADAGLGRVTVSLDALDDRVFRTMGDTDLPVARVLAGIDAAIEAGLAPVKVNTVVKRGVNEDEIVPLARHFRDRGITVRFIEYMDVGSTNGWRLDDVVPAAAILERLRAVFDLEPVPPRYQGEVARRWRHADGSAEIGLVTSVTQPFCGDCTRLRVSADGRLYTCLFAKDGHDLKALLRSGATDAELDAFVRGLWSARDDRYSEQRTRATPRDGRVEMSFIGG